MIDTGLSLPLRLTGILKMIHSYSPCSLGPSFLLTYLLRDGGGPLLCIWLGWCSARRLLVFQATIAADVQMRTHSAPARATIGAWPCSTRSHHLPIASRLARRHVGSGRLCS